MILRIKVYKNLYLKNYVRNTQKQQQQKLVYEKYLSHIAKMIDLKLRDEIQNIYFFLFIYLLAHTFISIKSDIKENPSWSAKFSLSIPNKELSVSK